MSTDRDHVVALLQEIWEARRLRIPGAAARLRDYAEVVAEAVLDPRWIGSALCLTNAGGPRESAGSSAAQEVRGLWLETWPRTYITLAERRPLELHAALLAASDRVAQQMETHPPHDAEAFHELLARAGAPPKSLQHPVDIQAVALCDSCDAAQSAAARAEARLDGVTRRLSDAGETVLARVVRQVIRGLQQLTDSRTSGDDSGLRDPWDEICVQVQYQESIHWDAYLDTIEGFALGAVGELTPYESFLVWLLTPSGEEWVGGEERASVDDDDARNVPVQPEDVAQLVVSRVLGKAANWSNTRIRLAIDRSYPEHD